MWSNNVSRMEKDIAAVKKTRLIHEPGENYEW